MSSYQREGDFFPHNSPYTCKNFQSYARSGKSIDIPSMSEMPLQSNRSLNANTNHLSISIDNRVQPQRNKLENQDRKTLEQKIYSLERQLTELTDLLKDQYNENLNDQFSREVGSLQKLLDEQRSFGRKTNCQLEQQRISLKAIQIEFSNEKEIAMQLEETLEKQKQFSTTLAKQLQASESNNFELRASLVLMGEQMKSFGKQMHESQTIASNSHQDSIKMQQEIAALRNNLKTLHKEFSELEQSYEQEHHTVFTLRGELDRLRRRNELLSEELNGFPEKDSRGLEFNRICEDLNYFKEKAQRLEREVALSKQQLHTISQTKLTSASDPYLLEIQNKRRKMEIGQLEERQIATKEKYRKIIHNLQERENQVREQADRYRKQLRSVQAAAEQSKYDYSELLEKEAQHTKLWQEKQTYLKNQIEKIGSQVYSLQKGKLQAEISARQLNQHIINLKKEHELDSLSLVDRISRQMEQQISKKANQIQKVRDDHEKAISIIKKSLKSSEQNQDKIESEMDSLLLCKQELSRQLNICKQLTIPSCQREINLLKTTVSQLQTKLQELFSKKESQMEKLSNEIQRKSLENTQLLQKGSELSKLYEQTAFQNTKITQEFQAYEQIQQINNEENLKLLRKLQEESQFNAIDNAARKSQVRQLEESLQKQAMDCDRLKNECNSISERGNRVEIEYQIYRERYEKMVENERQKRDDEKSAISQYASELKRKSEQIHYLQSEIVSLKKSLVEGQHRLTKSNLESDEEHQRLRAENQYHRVRIEKFFSEGLAALSGQNVFRNNFEDIRVNLEEMGEMLEQEKTLKSELEQHHQQSIVKISRKDFISKQFDHSKISRNKFSRHLSSSNFENPAEYSQICPQDGDQSKIAFAEQNQTLRKRLQRANRDISKLKCCIDINLSESGIIPLESTSCAIALAIWLIQLFSTHIKQYKKDLETLKHQKKQLKKLSLLKQVRNQGLQFDKQRLLAQMEVMLEKMRLLEGNQFPRNQTSYIENSGRKNENPLYNGHKVSPVHFSFGTDSLTEGIQISKIGKSHQNKKTLKMAAMNRLEQKSNLHQLQRDRQRLKVEVENVYSKMEINQEKGDSQSYPDSDENSGFIGGTEHHSRQISVSCRLE